jgi:hypothetical protein
MRSTDNGLTWNTEGITGVVETNEWYSVAYGGGVWVAVSNNGQVMRSTDNGLNWTTVDAPNFNYCGAVAYGDGVFVAVAYEDSTSRTNLVMRSSLS